MNPTGYEIPTEMRDFAERSVEQARKAFEGFISAAQRATGSVEGTATSVQAGAKTVGSKAMTFAETNVNAAFDLAQKMVKAKDMHELMSLQAEYVKAQMAAIQEQAKELGTAMQGVATTAGKSTAEAVRTATDTRNFR